MKDVLKKFIEGQVAVVQTDNGWDISSSKTIGGFLQWMRKSFGDSEDQLWQVKYEGNVIIVVEVIDEQIMTMVNLRWL